MHRFIRRIPADTGLPVHMKSASKKALSLKMLIRLVISHVFAPSQVSFVWSALFITCFLFFIQTGVPKTVVQRELQSVQGRGMLTSSQCKFQYFFFYFSKNLCLISVSNVRIFQVLPAAPAELVTELAWRYVF